MIPFLVALTFSILLTLVFVIVRWVSILITEDFNTGDMKVPTFYSTRQDTSEDGFILFMSVVGVVFGGIHCAGWFFIFPSSDEAMLWRVSSTVLTGMALLFPLINAAFENTFSQYLNGRQLVIFAMPVFTIILLVYVVSRFLLLAEALVSLRHLTPGMLALVKWTSFIPHI